MLQICDMFSNQDNAVIKKNVSLKEAKKHFHDASNIISEDKINNSF